MLLHANCNDAELDTYVQLQVSSGILQSDIELDSSIREAYRGTCAMEKVIRTQRDNIGRLNTNLSTALTAESELSDSLESYKTAFGDIEEISQRQNTMIKELVEDFDMYQRKQQTQYIVPAVLGLLAGYAKYNMDENATALDVAAYGAASFGLTLTLDQRSQLKVAGFIAKLWP